VTLSSQKAMPLTDELSDVFISSMAKQLYKSLEVVFRFLCNSLS